MALPCYDETMRDMTWAIAVGLACAAGCSGGTGAKKTVGASGGVVQSGDAASVSIPSGALAGDLSIVVEPNPAAPAVAGATAVGAAYHFGPDGTQFSKPVTVTLAFAPEKLPAGDGASQVAIFTAAAGSSAYDALPTTIVDASHVSAPASHFSNFVAAVVAQSILDGGGAPADLVSGGDLA